MNTILGDIIEHMMPDRAFESHYSQVGVFITSCYGNQVS